MSRKRLRIYADTSVIGGCLDDEFRETSQRLFRRFETGDAILVVSDTTIAELQAAPEEVRAILGRVPPEFVEYVSQEDEAGSLADEYIRQNVVSERMLADAQHIALATVMSVDVLVSWNFKHIVNLERIHGYNSVNLRAGYSMLEIRSPHEVLRDEDQGF